MKEYAWDKRNMVTICPKSPKLNSLPKIFISSISNELILIFATFEKFLNKSNIISKKIFCNTV